MSVKENSYIGQKGYTILKQCLTDTLLTEIKDELTLCPQENHGMKTIKTTDVSKIHTYRENKDKIYIPRFYGIEKFGLPILSPKLVSGDDIRVSFTKELRDYQKEIVSVYMNHVKSEEFGYNGGGILEVPCGRGKTIMALNICSQISKKTLILVHKGFLMNQWVERIREFLPSARVGIIQGKLFDIENKDIVIGMIQSIYNKEYCIDTFSSFGLTIIDEVHRIGSEEFSKALTKIVTPCMLGISATVDRKDGLTSILHMFIGPKIYHEERKDDDIVNVRGIHYTDMSNVEYNNVEYDFRGNVKYSTMISKISDYLLRTQFIIQVLGDLIREDDNKQIMILSHKRDLLKIIHDGICKNKISTCGYYIGGMKAAELEESETKQIVLATYSMAAEALDIKTLNTLVMVSPKTDIVQSVGRILRTRGDGKIIVDIIDSHDVFQNQWKKRKAFYNKSNYQIRTIKSVDYKGMDIDWNNDKDWKVSIKRCEKKCLIKI
jgi:superfamily II DNA or RNA helicase